MSVSCPAVVSEIARPSTSGAVVDSTPPSASNTVPTRKGRSRSPPAAMVATTDAIWSVVALASRSPIAVWARAARSSPGSGNGDIETGRSVSISVVHPKASAVPTTGSEPSSIASSANGMLHDRTRDSASVTSPPPAQVPPPGLRSTAVDPGRGSSSGSGRVLDGSHSPDSRAAAVTTSLNVDAGGASTRAPRSNRGWVSSSATVRAYAGSATKACGS